MPFEPTLLPALIEAIAKTIDANAEQITALDLAIGDGDHVSNLQRGIQALMAQRHELARLDWPAAWQKIGMTLMSTVGGASGSLFGSLFVAMAKAARGPSLDAAGFADAFAQGVLSVKQRGKAEAGEKTMLDVLVPAADYLQTSAADAIPWSEVLPALQRVTIAGMEATRDMVATKGRASFLEERSRGHIDAGAKTTQLMICAVADVLLAQ